jgi:hypothetical protein
MLVVKANGAKIFNKKAIKFLKYNSLPVGAIINTDVNRVTNEAHQDFLFLFENYKYIAIFIFLVISIYIYLKYYYGIFNSALVLPALVQWTKAGETLIPFPRTRAGKRELDNTSEPDNTYYDDYLLALTINKDEDPKCIFKCECSKSIYCPYSELNKQTTTNVKEGEILSENKKSKLKTMKIYIKDAI